MWAEVDKMVGRSGTPDALDVLQRQNLPESVRRFQNSVGRTVVWLRQRKNATMDYVITS
jgi:hypothetical protein